mmetsp:Transcript_75887/g.180330  ORF Transcript_75887/g.180330 Transcript_75887/m.180330 type:complete len:139 (-) Transcript_75887:252-668(-)
MAPRSPLLSTALPVKNTFIDLDVQGSPQPIRRSSSSPSFESMNESGDDCCAFSDAAADQGSECGSLIDLKSDAGEECSLAATTPVRVSTKAKELGSDCPLPVVVKNTFLTVMPTVMDGVLGSDMDVRRRARTCPPRAL